MSAGRDGLCGRERLRNEEKVGATLDRGPRMRRERASHSDVPDKPAIDAQDRAQALAQAWCRPRPAEYTASARRERPNVTAAAPPPRAPEPEGEAEKPEAEDGESDEAEVEAPQPEPRNGRPRISASGGRSYSRRHGDRTTATGPFCGSGVKYTGRARPRVRVSAIPAVPKSQAL